jgi:hypothetical protein
MQEQHNTIPVVAQLIVLCFQPASPSVMCFSSHQSTDMHLRAQCLYTALTLSSSYLFTTCVHPVAAHLLAAGTRAPRVAPACLRC